MVVIGNGPDSAPPVLSISDARLVDQAGTVALELKVRAIDNISVVAVNYTAGVTQLGARRPPALPKRGRASCR